MLHQRRSLLGVVIIGCTGVLLAAGVGRASGDRPALVGAASTRGDLEHSERERRTIPLPPTMEAVSGAGCPDGPNLNWVTTVRALPDCFSYDMHDDEDAEDWNGDGRVDFVNHNFGVRLLESGVPQPAECLATVTMISRDGDTVVLTRSCICDSTGLIAYALQRFPGRTVEVWSGGWRDVDTDGDLDYIILLAASPVQSSADRQWVWLENTGYEAADGLAADLNGDGAVDGKDLTALLAAWTG